MKFFLGLLVGFTLGVAAGLVLAPQSGEATLAQLGEQSVMLSDRSAGLIDQIRTRATDALSQGREIYGRTKDELTDRYSKAKSGQL
jgi:gas vesicle protein